MGAVVEARGLTKRYGSARGVEDLDFDVEAGAIFGFLGPNGAGKSTTIRTMLDFQRPTPAGPCGCSGSTAAATASRSIAGPGTCPGDLQLFPKLTGREHVDAFTGARGSPRRTTVEQLIERFGAELDRPVRELSKGNRQKVGLLLAFMHDPELLVLDEPTAGLDPLMQEEFQRAAARSSGRRSDRVPVVALARRGAASRDLGGADP